MGKGLEDLSPEARRVAQEFLDERSRARAAIFEQALGIPHVQMVEKPHMPVSMGAEEALAVAIIERVNGGMPTTSDERQYIRAKLHALDGEFVPAAIRAMPSMDKLVFEARLLAIDRGAKKQDIIR